MRGKPSRGKTTFREVAGIHAVREVLRVHAPHVKKLYLDRNFSSHEALREINGLAVKAKVPTQLVGGDHLDRICRSHQGVAAEVDITPEFSWETVTLKSRSLIVAVDGLNDPHNLGAILRTLWLLGGDAVLSSKSRSVSMTAAVAKVACGGAEHVPVRWVTAMDSELRAFREKGYWILGLDSSGKQKLHNLKIPDKVVWVVGGEDSGIRGGARAECDEFIQIQQTQTEASLNASVTAGLVCFETFRQWQTNSL